MALAPFAVLILLWLLFFWRILTPVQADRLTFQQGDFTLQFLAYRQMAFRQFAEGRFPVIEECLYSGHPFQADPQSQVLYPPVLATMLLGRALGWSDYPLRALEWEVMLHVLLAAVGMYVFLRLPLPSGERAGVSGPSRGQRGVTRLAALIGAVAYAFSGFMTGYAMLQTAILQTAAWLPLILLAIKWLATAKRWLPAAALLAVLVFFAFTAGHPQTLLFSVYTGAIAFVWWSRQALSPRGRGLGEGEGGKVTRALIAGALAIGLSAAQLIPTLSFMLASTRASLSFEQAGRGFPLQDVSLFVLTGVTNVWQPLYVSILALALAGVAISGRNAQSVPTARRDDTWLWVILAIGALLLSFGANAFGFDLAYLAAPGYRQFQAQERHAVVVALALSVLAAYGANVLLRPMRPRARFKLRRAGQGILLAGAVAFAALIAVLIAERAVPENTLAGVGSRVALIAIGLAGTGALFMWRARLGRTPRWLWGCAALGLLVFDLFSANRFSATQPWAEPFVTSALLQPIQQTQTPNSHSRAYNHFGLPLNGACVAGLNEVGGGSPIVLRDYAEFLRQVPEDVMVKLLNVRHAVTWRGAMTTPEGKEVPWFLLARDQFEGREASTYRLDWEPQNFNGAWVAQDVWQTTGDVTLIGDLMSQLPDYQPLEDAIISQRDQSPSFGKARGAAAIEGKTPGYIKVAANADSPTLLVVSQAYHWNWVALVNSREVKPVVVNGALLGVPIPAGPSAIEFSYRPLDLYVGAAISALTIVIMLAALIISQRSKRV
jgi:hypothetical protein